MDRILTCVHHDGSIRRSIGGTEMKDIFQAIREKRDAIARLQKDLEVLEHAAALLRGDASTAMEPEAPTRLARSTRRRRGPRFPFQKKSAAGQAAAVLAEAQ